MKITQEQYLYFISVAEPIIKNPEYQKLKNYRHHFALSRYEHCFDVALYAYYFAIKKKKKINLEKIIRAGLLHDFYLYSRQEEKIKRHFRNHPKVAYSNATSYFEIDDTEKNIILSHMWPAIGVFPKCKEARIVNRADKVCAAIETFKLQKKLKAQIFGKYQTNLEE